VSQTHITISVAALGKTLGIYGHQLAPDERVPGTQLRDPLVWHHR